MDRQQRTHNIDGFLGAADTRTLSWRKTNNNERSYFVLHYELNYFPYLTSCHINGIDFL